MVLFLSSAAVLVLILSGSADETLRALSLKRATAACFVAVFAITHFFSASFAIGAVQVELTGTLLSLLAFGYLFSCATGGWEKYRCALCACILASMAYLAALTIPEQTDAFFLEHTWMASAAIAAFAFISCNSSICACACTILSSFAVTTAVSLAHHVCFETAVQIAGEPLRTLCLNAVLFSCLLFSLTLTLQRLSDAHAVHS